MTQGRDSKGHFIKGNVPWNKRAAKKGRDKKGLFIKGRVPWNKRVDSSPPAIASSPPTIASSPPAIASRMLIGGGVVKKDCVQVTCPACREQVKAIVRNGWVKGYCTVARQYVDFRVKT